MSQSYRARIADAVTASELALPCSAGSWTSGQVGSHLEIALPDLPAGTLIVPSLSTLGKPVDWHVELHSDAGALALPSVPPVDGEILDGRNTDVRSLLDCYRSERDLSGARLRYFVNCEPPDRFLCVTSARPELLDEASSGGGTASPVAAATHSQRLLAEQLADRTCSPVSAAMALGGLGIAANALDIVEDCWHPTAGIYGVWPLAVRAAGKRGVLATIEACTDFSVMSSALAAGSAVVASIRFEAGDLPEAPLERTGGHLVTVIGLDDDVVTVHDPAATRLAEVRRRYPREAFATAWLRARGVGVFFFLPGQR